jgi:CheY-like chemotaxis protein
VFRFTLPLVEKGEARAPDDRDRARERGEPGVVLVVDDEPEVVRAIRGCLEDEGLTVISAASASSGATIAAERRPDLILLDLMLPDRGLLERSLKSDPATSRIPVLVLSARRETLAGLTRGASENLTKPIDRHQVAAAVARLLDGVAERDPTVLVVDDEGEGAEVVRDTLRDEGFRTVVAHQARQAMEIIARARPDLVVLDLMMPDMSGFEVLEALGRDPATATIPALVLTARGDAPDRRALALGPQRSPDDRFDGGALVAEVRRHLGGREREGARRAAR